MRLPFAPSRFAAALGVAFLILGPPMAALGQAPVPRPALPPEAAGPMNEALTLLEQIRRSNLERSWRAAAEARAARMRARAGDLEAAVVLAQNAELAAAEPPSGQAAIPQIAILALVAQALAEANDPAAARAAIELALGAVQRAEPLARAGAYPAIALARAILGDRPGAAALLLEGLRAASAAPPGRERTAALGQIALGQAQLGDRDAAAVTTQALDQASGAAPDALSRVAVTVQRARIDAALGRADAARGRLRQVAAEINPLMADPSTAAPALIAQLATYAVAQRESGDREAARQATRAIAALMPRVTQPYERFVSLVTQADAILQVER